MIKLLRPLLLVVLFVLPNSKTFATHFMGGDLSWLTIGEDSILVTLTVYRDCNNKSWPSFSTTLTVKSNCKKKTYWGSINKVWDRSPVCNTVTTPCDNPIGKPDVPYGIMEYNVSWLVPLKEYKSTAGCCDLTFSWATCCRSSDITTGAQNQRMYLESSLDICNGKEDNSPTFLSHPVFIIPLGRDYHYSAKVFDRDGDSLRYSFARPLDSIGKETKWNSSYTYDKPINYLGFPKVYATKNYPRGMLLDSATGDLRFRPMRLERTIVAIKVESFRNGKKNAEVVRDFQFIVERGANSAPVISGVDCSYPRPENFLVEACAGQELSFNFCVTDADKNDSIFLRKILSPPGSKVTMTRTAKNRWDGELTWTPDTSDIGKRHELVLYAVDSVCPLVGSNFATFKIVVNHDPKPSIKQIIDFNSQCDGISLKARVSNSVVVNNWEWSENDSLISTDSSFTHRVDKPGKKIIKLIGKKRGCRYYFTDSLTIDSFEQVQLSSIGNVVLCKDSLAIVNMKPAIGAGNYTYSFKLNSKTVKSTDSVFRHRFPDATDTFQIPYVVESNNCFWEGSFNVVTRKNKTVNLEGNRTICDRSEQFKLKRLTWNRGNWAGNGVNSNTFTASQVSGPTTLHFSYNEGNYCLVDSAVMYVKRKESRFNDDTISTCPKHDTIPLPAPSGGYLWKGGKLVGKHHFYDPESAKTKQVKCIYNLDSACHDSFIMYVVKSKNNIVVHADADDTLCFNGTDKQYCMRPATTGGIWSGPALDANSNSCINLAALTEAKHGYSYRFTNKDYCTDDDSFYLHFGESVSADFKADATIGAPSFKVNFTDLSTGKVKDWRWRFGDFSDSKSKDQNTSFTYHLEGKYSIELRVRDSLLFCEDIARKTDYIYVTNDVGFEENVESGIEIYPIPVIDALTITNLPEGTYNYKVSTIEGKVVINSTISAKHPHVDVAQLKGGVYLIHLSKEGQVLTSRFIIAR